MMMANYFSRHTCKRVFREGWMCLAQALLSCFPLKLNKKKIVFCANGSRGYSDSSKAIADQILREEWRVTLVVVANASKDIPDAVVRVKPHSVRAAYHMATAGIWVDNVRKPPYIRKRWGQFYVQTWHGFPLKRIEKDVENSLSAYYLRSAINDSRMCDVMVSNSQFLTSLYHKSFWYEGETLTCGFPRNDILANVTPEEVGRIKRSLGLPLDQKLLLYAPTFRRDGNLDVYQLDSAQLITACEQSFGGTWQFGARLHPNIGHLSSNLCAGTSVVDLSGVPDPQLLLVAADALITDYSSVMFDYLLTGRPCFVYAPDINEYVNERGFYFDLRTLPFSVATTSDELVDAILNFDTATYDGAVKTFVDYMGFVTAGHASQSVVERLKTEVEVD